MEELGSESDYLPTAALEMLQFRARLLKSVREFFEARGYLEVETPLLSHDVVVDAWLEPFVVQTERGSELFLQTSPEFGMKRLLCAGAQAIYQITRAFRQGESGRLHNPEFTIVEWYHVGDTHYEQMQFVEELVAHVMPVERPFERLSYDEAFERHAGSRVLLLDEAGMVDLAYRHGLTRPAGLRGDDRDGWLNWLLCELVEPHLGRSRGTLLYDYPASQAALAKVREEVPPVAERFELYLNGIEICNGYHELTDAEELRRCIERQTAIRRREGRRDLPRQSRLLGAMEAGLPPCAGVALGFDRLVMLAAGVGSLNEVTAFPIERA